MSKVSVVMSTYNRADTFLPKAIESVINQSYKDWELIIVDDCSTDQTTEVVKSYQKKDPRIIYVLFEQNSGSDTRPKNLGILNASGEYIAYLDDDCEWYPFHLEILMQRMDKGDVDVVYCDAIIRDEQGQFQQAIAMDFDAQFLLKRNFIDTSNVLHKRDLAVEIGGFDETLPKFIDWNMWVRMMKYHAKFARVPVIGTIYNVHANTKSRRVETASWKDPMTGMMMFEPTFDPAGCYIQLEYLPRKRDEKRPRVAIFTITYDRLDYTKEMKESLDTSADYPYDWFVYDNGSTDGTQDWLASHTTNVTLSPDNKGITIASNSLINAIKQHDYDIIIKVDNDAKFMTRGWLKDFVDLWRRNHRLYMSPYPEGLVHNPGGAPRVGSANIGPYFVEVTKHIGGLVASIDSHAYDDFRFTDQFLHGNQDMEASTTFRSLGYMPCYISQHRVLHNDGTTGQYQKYPEYFERRKSEKTQTYKENK